MTRGFWGGLGAAWRRPVGVLLAVTVAGMALLGAPSVAVADGTTATPQVVIQETQDGQPVFDPTAGPGNDTGPNNGIVRTSDLVTYSVTMSINDPTAPTQTTFQNTKATFAPLALGFKWDSLPLDCSGPGSAITGDGVSTPSVLVCNFGAKTSGTTWNFKPAIKVLRTAASGTPLAPSATLSADSLVKTGIAAAPDVIVSVSQAPKAGVTIAAPAPAAVTTLNGGRAQEYIYPVGIHVDAGSDVINGNSFSFTADLSGLPAGTVLKDCEPEGGSSLPSSTPAAGGGQVRGVPSGSGTWTCTPDPANPKLIHITAKGVNTDPTVCPDHGADGTLLVSGMCYVATQWLRLIVPDSGLSAGGSQNTMWVSNLSAVDTLGNPNYGGANDPGTGKTNNDVASTPYLAGKQHGWTSNFPGPPSPGNGLPLNKVDTTYVDNFNGGSPTFTPGGATSDNIQRTSTGINSPQGGNGYVSQTGRYAGLTMVTFPGIVDVPTGFTQCMTIDNKNSTIIPLNGGTPTHGALLYTQASLLSAGWVVEYGTGGNGGVNPGDGTGWASTAAQQAGSCNTSDSPAWYTDITKVPGGPGAITKIRASTTAPITIAQQLAAPCSGNCRAELNVTLQVRASTPSGTVVPNYGWFTNDPSAMSGANPTGTVTSTFNAATRGGSLGDSLIVTGVRAMISKSASVQQTLAGKTVDFTLRPATDGLGSPTPFQALNLTVTDTLPKGETYAPGSSLCGSTACEPSVTMNADGTTTLVWSLGSPVAGTPVAPVTYKATIGALVSDGTSLVNTAVISADNDGSPAQYRTATATVSVVNSASFAVQKSLANPLTEPNAPKVFNLTFTNLSNNTYTGTDFIDWLPFNGDKRTPATSFHGTLTLAGPAVDVAGAQTVTFKYTSFPTASLNMATDTDPATANPAIVWCDPAQFGTPGCPANYAAATGIRINGGQITAQQSDTVTYTLNSAGDAKGDVYSNQSTGEVAGLGLPISSNTATGQTVLASIAGTVWNDTNVVDGLHAASGEPGLSGVTVQLLNSTGSVVGTTTTDSTGHYLFPNLLHGTYTVRVVPPAGMTTTLKAQGTDPALNSKINYGTNTTDPITLAVGQNQANENAGFFTPTPAITLEKDLNGAHVPDPNNPLLVATGSAMNVTFKVTNTGNVALNPVTVTDDTIASSAINCPATTLAVGASMTCTATTPAPTTAGGTHANHATATGTGRALDGTALTDATAKDEAHAYTPDPHLALVKTATPATVNNAGSTVSYSFLVTNTGNVTLTGVSVAETAFSGTGTAPAITCPAGAASVAPGASVTCTATYAVTQADVDAGTVTNTAVAQGTPPLSLPAVLSNPSSAILTAQPGPAITLVKSATPAQVSKAGDSVSYSFLVTNTGNVTLTGVGVTETAFSGTGTAPAITCPAGAASLAPGASVTCTATYQVTQADVDAGKVTNTATAQGTPPGATTPVVSAPSSAVVTVPPTPGIALVKSATPAQVSKAGDTVAYSFLVTNTGNVTLANVGIMETAFSGTGTVPAASCPPGTLAPGASVTCTATYAVTQADVDAGTVTNTATAQGTPPNTATPVVSNPSSAIVTAQQTAAITLVKSATPTQVSKAGDSVSYSFLVTNTGNVTLTGVGITETAFSGTGTAPAITCPAGAASLAPGASVTCTATYQVTQADVDAGKVTNTATAQGTPPGSTTPVVSAPSSAVVTVPPTPAITLVKSATPTTVHNAGDTVTYSFLVTNTGNVTLANVGITETAFSGTGTGTAPAASCPAAAASLAPGASVTCTATYQVTQADVDTGTITNTATAQGTPPGSATPVVSNPSSATVTAQPGPALTLVKSASPSDAAHFTVGQQITYTFVVTNNGNVTLTNVGVTDTAFTGTGTLSAITCPAGAASLAPGASVTCTATYQVTQADVDAGSVTNTAVAHGTPPGTNTPVDSNPSTVKIPGAQNPALALVKSATPAQVSKAGDTVTYSFLVTNTGNVTLANVGITETAFSGTGTAPAATCPPGTLAPGASVTCTATYAVTQADVDAGTVTNTATAQGTPPNTATPVVSAPSSATVTAQPGPAITLVKSATPTQVTKAGDSVSYSFLVTNTGNVTLTGVGVTETAFSGTGTAPAITCPAGAASLAPGASVTCTATYQVTQADVDAGKVTNTATAQGTPPGTTTPVVSAPSSAVVTVPPTPAITLVKSATPTTVHNAGDTVTYSFLVTNTGNVTLANVGITETAFSGTGTAPAASCPAAAASLAPGASVTCTATYQVTQADVDAGTVTNTATAQGTPPGSATPVVSNPSSATVTIPPAPALTVVKSASPSDAAHFTVGQQITYSFVVTNTGNVTLTNVGVTDTGFTGHGTLSPVACPGDTGAGITLAPGAQATCTASYTIVQADVDAGSLDNDATAHGTPPGSTTPVDSPKSHVDVPAAQSPALTLAKTADTPRVDHAGQTITYSFLVTNTGNVTISGVGIREDSFNGSGTISPAVCPPGATDLEPGASVTCTATYRVTQADLDSGVPLVNTATATGKSPAGKDVASNQSTATVTTPGAPVADPPGARVETGGYTLTGPGSPAWWTWALAAGTVLAACALVLSRRRSKQ